MEIKIGNDSCFPCACSRCIVGDFDECDICYGEVHTTTAEEETLDEENIYEDDELEMFEMKSNAMMEVVEPGSYVALNSHTHFEMFYLYEVLQKSVAEEEIEEDDSGHLFTRGEQYLKCRYLQTLKQKKGMHYYNKHAVVVFVNPLHILCPCVNVSEDLTLSADDFQFLTDAML